MSAGGTFAAQYFDGRTARAHAATVDIGTNAVRIFAADGSVLADWPAASVYLTEPFRDDRPIRLRDGNSGDARLSIADPTVYESLLRRCPNLRHRGGRLRDHWKAVLLWGTGAVASIALLVLVGLPFLANLVADAIPVDVEAAWGEEIADQAAGMFSRAHGGGRAAQFCETPAGRAALDRLTGRLAQGGDLALPLTVRVLDVPAVNAFALPGGQIVLFSGFLDQARNAGEVAGVLAHEIGHVAHRHPLELAVEQVGLATLLGFLFGDVSGGTIIVAGTQLLLLTSYTREAERDADAVAVALLNAADIAADGMAGFFDRISRGGGDGSGVLAMLDTHPVSAERAAAIRAAATGREPALADSDWHSLQTMCHD